MTQIHRNISKSPAFPLSTPTKWICLFICLGVVSGCGGGGGTAGSPAPVIEFSKNRAGDFPNDFIAPILSDRLTADPAAAVVSDFDYLEVDSPCMVDDNDRIINDPISGACTTCDRYMLFYEATDGATLENSIGLITSDEYNFDPILGSRTRVLTAAELPQLEFDGALRTALNVTDPSVLLNKSVPVGVSGRYLMWFEGTYGIVGQYSATLTCQSADGLTWSTPAFCPGLEVGPSFGNVIRISDPEVIQVNSDTEPLEYRMVFEAVRDDGSSVIGMATSANGLAWTVTDGALTGVDAGPIFSGGPGAFDDFAVRSPTIEIERDNLDNIIEWHLFYEGQQISSDNDSFIGYSNSVDGFSWSGYAVPVISPSSDNFSPVTFDSDDVKHPHIALREQDPLTEVNPDLNRMLLYYSGDPQISDGTSVEEVNRIGLAVSE
ncbi:MAG: hypothetical protein GWP41_02115 [Planctomycetia bacterium]|nr:hypothetical protein [Planctomycetia bacterium]